jgi:LysM repeat protein
MILKNLKNHASAVSTFEPGGARQTAEGSPKGQAGGPGQLRTSNLRRASRGGGIILKGLVILALTAAVFGGGAYFAYTLFIEPDQNLKRENAFGAPSPPPDMTIPEYERCAQLKRDHQWVDARAAYEHFLETYPASTRLDAARDDLGEVNVAIYFSSGPSPDKQAYVIRPGDTLARIEHKLKTSGDEIMRTNNITDPRRLRLGDTLYISHPDFSIVIDRKARIVTLYNHARFFKQYHPTGWTVPPVKGNPAPIAGKVTELASFKNGQRVAFGSHDYDDSSHWVQITPGGYTLYTDPAQGGEKANSGIPLSSSDMDELSALLTRGVPVTIR